MKINGEIILDFGKKVIYYMLTPRKFLSWFFELKRKGETSWLSAISSAFENLCQRSPYDGGGGGYSVTT